MQCPALGVPRSRNMFGRTASDRTIQPNARVRNCNAIADRDGCPGGLDTRKEDRANESTRSVDSRR